MAGVGALLAIPSIANRITYLFTADYLAASRRAGRVIRWSKGLKLLQESNPVLGFGLGRFGGAVAMQNKVIEETKDFSYFYMDNYYLKTLVEMGYLGLAFFILLLFGLVLWSLRSIGRTGYTKGDRTRVLAVSMFAGMCGVLVHCYFENIFEVPYMMAYFWSMAAACFIGGTLFTGLYPSFLLTRIRPADIMRGKLLHGRKGNRMRKMLIVAQFLASFVLVSGTLVVIGQVRYMQQETSSASSNRVLVVKYPAFTMICPSKWRVSRNGWDRYLMLSVSLFPVLCRA